MSLETIALPVTINTFTSFTLTAEQELHGHILQPLQVAVIQNEIAAIAQKKLQLIFDPLNPTSKMLEDAELQGQLSILQYLIANSDKALSSSSVTSEEEFASGDYIVNEDEIEEPRWGLDGNIFNP